MMFGLGTKLNYVKVALALFKQARPGRWHKTNDVSYTDGLITVVHVEHFASQGALIPNWRGTTLNERAKFGLMAREACLPVAHFGASNAQ